MSSILPWSSVHAIHRTVAGIYGKDGVAKSLICSPLPTGPYSNSIKSNVIEYRVDSRTQSHGVIALIAALEKKTPVSVFEKIDVNKWRSLGQWVVKDIVEEPDSGTVMFRLRPL